MNRFDLQDKSDEYVKELADKGEFIGIFEYGMRLYNQDKNEEAFSYLYKLKDYNNFFIWERLIDIAYYEVKGIISDEELFQLLLKRHNYGVSSFSYILAYCYKDGIGTEKNIKKYIEVLKMVANDGSRYATIELAECYEKGFGVRKNLKKAFDLYYHYVDEHFKMDFECAYKSALYMLNEWGGAKKDMMQIEYHLRYAARVENEAKKLYIELFNKEPEW